jgi:hypothetical protein
VRALAATTAVLVLAAGTALGIALARDGGSATESVRRAGPLPGELTGGAPWPANNGATLRPRLAAAGLPALSREGSALHIHVHLDLFVDGRRVTVPAGVGIDRDLQFISPLHTHDATGIVHVESPTVRTFTLGELFDVWGVRLSRSCLGGYCARGGSELRVYADGRPVADPRGLALAPHQEIVVAFGTERQLPRPLPAHYDFPAGL